VTSRITRAQAFGNVIRMLLSLLGRTRKYVVAIDHENLHNHKKHHKKKNAKMQKCSQCGQGILVFLDAKMEKELIDFEGKSINALRPAQMDKEDLKSERYGHAERLTV